MMRKVMWVLGGVFGLLVIIVIDSATNPNKLPTEDCRAAEIAGVDAQIYRDALCRR